MEPIFQESGKLKGTEVLYFDNVELEKTKGGSNSFGAMGTLSVLYFKDYNRFILHLNDWRYPLMRRIPITSSSEGSSRVLTLPALNGFEYQLKLSDVNGPAWSNFETILSNNSNFGGKGEKKLEKSPDDKITRESIQKQTASLTEKFTEALKHGVDKVKGLTSGVNRPSSGKNSKTRSNLKDIKNKDFKKEAHSTFKKDFFDKEESLSKKFSELRGHNRNISEVVGFDDLRKTNDNNAPALYLWKEEVEESILNNKDLIEQRHFVASS